MNIDEAWAKYTADCDAMLKRMTDDPICEKYTALRANAHFIMQQTQAIAYNTVMAPHPDCPVFTKHHFIMPLYYTAHQPNPDFCYYVAFLNGKRTWRITGNRNSAHWVDMQSGRGWWGDADNGGIENYDLDDFAINSDGSFEIIASPDPQPGNWIRLDPESRLNNIQVRPAIYDWSNEVPPRFEIEAMDSLPAQPVIHDEEEIIRRLALSGEMIRHCIGRWTTRGSPRLVEMAGMNNFVAFRGDPSRGGANPLALYGQAAYEVGPDEALIIEADWPVAKYWGISLGTWWWETTDTTHHHSSINGHQAVRDSDGKFRAVLANRDPGVTNWLDTAGWETGIILFRWYRPEFDYTVKTTKVRLDELDGHLPADIGRSTPEERRKVIQGRKRAVMRWYDWSR